MWTALLGFVLAVAYAPGGDGAVVEGTVTLLAATPVPVAAPRYPLAASYAVEDADPVRAVVFLEDVGGEPVPGRARMAQRGYQFRPGILAIVRGTVVEFPNLDDEYHSVFSYSKARRFDLGRYRKDEKPAAVTFDTSGTVRLFCEIHDHMRGTILVLDTPYFVVTDGVGHYRLEGLPAGRFVLKAWIDEDDVRSAPVELDDGTVARVDFPTPAAAP